MNLILNLLFVNFSDIIGSVIYKWIISRELKFSSYGINVFFCMCHISSHMFVLVIVVIVLDYLTFPFHFFSYVLFFLYFNYFNIILYYLQAYHLALTSTCCHLWLMITPYTNTRLPWIVASGL